MNTVLVVDHAPEIRSALCRVLGSAGFKAHGAANRREAIDIYRQFPADVVIIDLRMSESDGHEAVRRFKQLDEHIVTLMLTDRGDSGDTAGAHPVEGIHHYLSKPLEHPGRFIAALKGAVEIRRLKQENKALLSRLEAVKGEQQKAMVVDAGAPDPSTDQPDGLQRFEDINELRQAQEHIRLSKMMLQAVFDGISDPLLMVDRFLMVRMLNLAAKRYYRIKDYKDLLGKRCDTLFLNPSNRETCNIPQAVSSGRALVFERPGHMAGEKIEKVTIYPLSRSAAGPEGAIIQITDITETKAIERQIIQNEKLAALGMLVSGVAHEINNPNNFITFNIPILKSYMKALLAQISVDTKDSQTENWFGMSFKDFSDEIFKLIGNLEHGTHRIAAIVDNLRTLVEAETGGKARKPCDMGKIVRHADALCRSEIQQYVKTFEVQCPDELPAVVSDSAALEQILINLLINAAHAANKPDSKIVLTVAIENQILKLEVEDNGAGMDEETLKKIFDPFFTTKDPGLGTGLGLCVCHSLINAMHGTLNVKSALNSGTVFSVEIPVRYADEPDRPDHASEVVLSGRISVSQAQ